MDDNTEKRPGRRAGAVRSVCFVAVVLLLLGGCSIYMRFTPDREYSSEERRMLRDRPKLKKKKVLNGKFQRAYEVYLSEQFPARPQWVTLQAKLFRILGNKDANGVYFGKDDYLLERYREQDFDWPKVQEDVAQIGGFLEEHPQARVMFVPTKSNVLSKKLPLFAEGSGESRFYEIVDQEIPSAQQISVMEGLRAHEQEYIYYRTDHHWTTLGAYYAYQEWAKAMGFTPMPQESFQVTAVSDTFLGTTYAKVRTGGKADTISLYEAADGQKFALDYNLGEFQSDSFYDMEKLEGDDPYSVFLGGNQAFVDIRTADGEAEDKTLLIIKDSFGNCFAPFAACHYGRTIVVDMRYVNVPVSSLLQAYPADDILILYNSVQFMEDKDVSKIK